MDNHLVQLLVAFGDRGNSEGSIMTKNKVITHGGGGGGH